MRAWSPPIVIGPLSTVVVTWIAAAIWWRAEPSLADESSKVFVGYAYQTPQANRFDLYTHVCHAFVVADEEGRLKRNASVPSRSLVRDAHAQNVKVLLSLGGWGWDRQFAALTSSPSALSRYVAEIMQLVEQYGYDGVDLDW